MPGIVLGAMDDLLVRPGPNVCQSGMEGMNFGTAFIHSFILISSEKLSYVTNVLDITY